MSLNDDYISSINDGVLISFAVESERPSEPEGYTEGEQEISNNEEEEEEESFICNDSFLGEINLTDIEFPSVVKHRTNNEFELLFRSNNSEVKSNTNIFSSYKSSITSDDKVKNGELQEAEQPLSKIPEAPASPVPQQSSTTEPNEQILVSLPSSDMKTFELPSPNISSKYLQLRKALRHKYITERKAELKKDAIKKIKETEKQKYADKMKSLKSQIIENLNQRIQEVQKQNEDIKNQKESEIQQQKLIKEEHDKQKNILSRIKADLEKINDDYNAIQRKILELKDELSQSENLSELFKCSSSIEEKMINTILMTFKYLKKIGRISDLKYKKKEIRDKIQSNPLYYIPHYLNTLKEYLIHL